MSGQCLSLGAVCLRTCPGGVYVWLAFVSGLVRAMSLCLLMCPGGIYRWTCPGGVYVQAGVCLQTCPDDVYVRIGVCFWTCLGSVCLQMFWCQTHPAGFVSGRAQAVFFSRQCLFPDCLCLRTCPGGVCIQICLGVCLWVVFTL